MCRYVLLCVIPEIFFYLQDNTTPIWIASQNGHLPVVEHLIAAKADINTPDEVGYQVHSQIIVQVFILHHHGNKDLKAIEGGDHEA